MLRDPVEKRPCIGCGYCCISNTCTFGVTRHPDRGEEVCPELHWNGKRYICRLMATPNKMADFYRQELQAGGGCRSFNNPWRKDMQKKNTDEARSVKSGTPWPSHPD